MKTALITGVTGQDGSYLAEFLLAKGHIVHSIKRRASSFNTQRVDHRGVNEVGYWTNRPDSSLRAQRGNPGSMDRHGLQPRDDEEVTIVKIDPRYFRPTEVASLLGDPTKAKEKLGWVPEITLDQMVTEMVSADLADAKKHALLKQHGYNVNVSVE